MPTSTKQPISQATCTTNSLKQQMRVLTTSITPNQIIMSLHPTYFTTALRKSIPVSNYIMRTSRKKFIKMPHNPIKTLSTAKRSNKLRSKSTISRRYKYSRICTKGIRDLKNTGSRLLYRK